MPTGDRRADVVRRVEGLNGTVSIRHSWVVRFDYGKIRPWVHREQVEGEPGHHRHRRAGQAHPHRTAPATGGRRAPRGDLRRRRGRAAGLHAHLDPVVPEDPRRRRHRRPARAGPSTSSRRGPTPVEYAGPWRRQVVRSLVTLRGLTHVDTGGIVAAPTTSLPEDFGGERNWDYRYCWLRDAALTLESLLAAGRDDAAHHWRDWLLRAIAGDPDDMQVMYTVEGGRHLPERELDHLAGLRGLATRARRQRRGRPAADRRARRGDVRAVDGPQPRRRRRPVTAGASSAPWSTSSPRTGAGPTTACGRSAGSSATSRTAG